MLRVGAPLDRHAELLPWVEIAHARGASVAVCEGAVGGGLPGYRDRRAWTGELPARFTCGVLAFTDPARLAFVWSWMVDGGMRWVEHALPGREATLELGLRRWSPCTTPRTPGSAGDDLLRVLIRRVDLPAGADPSLPSLLHAVAECDSVESLRRFWRALTRIRILDRGDGDPGWLLDCAATLEPLHLAAIDRMRVWLDGPRAKGARRTAFLRDFHGIVEAVENPCTGRDGRLAIRRRIVRTNLFAALPDRAALRRSEAGLREYASLDPRLPGLVALNTCICRGTAGSAGSASRSGGADLDLQVLRRGWARIREIASGGSGGTSPDLRRAAGQIARRRRMLMRRTSPGTAPPAVLFSGVESRSGFALVREGVP